MRPSPRRLRTTTGIGKDDYRSALRVWYLVATCVGGITDACRLHDDMHRQVNNAASRLSHLYSAGAGPSRTPTRKGAQDPNQHQIKVGIKIQSFTTDALPPRKLHAEPDR